MATAGTLVINLLLNTAGVTSGLASVEAQLKAFDAQITGTSAAGRAKLAADAVARAQDNVALASGRAQVATMRLAAADNQLVVAQAKVASVKVDQLATAEALTAAETAEAGAAIRLAAAKNTELAATVAVADAERGLLAARELAANPPIVKNSQFPLIGAAAAIASFAILKFGDDSVKAAAQFEFEMRMIQTQARASSDELHNMSDAVLNLAPSVQAGPEQLAKALFHIESVGYRDAQALDILKTAAQGAAVGNADLESVTNALVAAVTTGIKGAQDMAEAMGVLNATVGVGNLRMEDLAKSLSSGVLATAKQFGLTLTDVGAALATMADQGIPAEEAATRLRITIALIGAPTKLATAQLERIGLTQRSLADAMRGPQGLIGALDLLKAKMDAANLDEVEQSQLLKTAFGGSRSSAGILTLLNSLPLMKQKLEQLNEAKLDFPERFAEESKTAEAQFRNMSAALQVMAVRIGNGVLPVARVLAQLIGFIAQQTYITIPLFTLLTAAVTIWATTSVVKFVSGTLGMVASLLSARIAASSLTGTVTGLTLNTSLLADAETILAGTYEATLPVLLGATQSLSAQTAVIVAETAAIDPLVAGLASMDGAIVATTAATDGLVAGLAGADGAMAATAATSGPLVAGLVGADGALLATAASTGPVVEGFVGIDGAQASVVASAGPVVTSLQFESRAMIEAATAAEALAIAQANVAKASAVTTVTNTAVATGLVARIAASLSGLPLIGGLAASFAASGATLGSIMGTAIGIAIPIAIGAVIVVGLVSLFKAVFMPWLDQMANDFKSHVHDAIASGTLADLQHYRSILQSQLDKSKQGFHPIEDFFGATPVNALQSSLDEVNAAIDTQMTQGGITAADGFASGFSSESGANADAVATDFAKTLQGVSDAAGALGSEALRQYAQGVADAEDAPVNAYKNMVDQIEKELSVADQIAQGVGILSSEELAKGLADGDPRVAAAAAALRKTTIDNLDMITEGAYTAGTETGKTWQDAFAQSLKANGASDSQVQVAMAKLTPDQIHLLESEFASLGNEWRNHLAPGADAAAAAFKRMKESLGGTASIADQAKAFVASAGDDLKAIADLGATSGAEMMDGVAKGIKERRDAPLNALKELHTAMQDQFSKNREIALLWAELQSKDIVEGLRSGDPYVLAKTQETIDLIGARLDELTGGAYSKAYGGGVAIGAGLNDAAPVVTAGAQAAVAPVGPVIDATNASLGAFGFQGGANYGAGLASAAPVVGTAASVIAQTLNTVFGAVDAALGQLGLHAGASFAAGLMTGTDAHPGKLADDMLAIGGSSTAAKPPTQSFMEYLNQALKQNGDMSKYLQDQLNGVAHTSASARSDMTTAFADIKASAETYFQTLHDKNLQAIHDAHDQKNAILDAKEALNQAPVTAAQKALDFQRHEIERWRLQMAIQNATTPEGRRDAILAYQDFLAQSHIDEMQAEVDSAKDSIEAQKKKNDQLEKDRVAAEDRRYEKQKKDFARELAALQRFLANHPKQWQSAQAQVLSLLSKYGVSYNTAGAALGAEFAAGIRSQVNAAYEAAKALATAGAGVPPSQIPPAPPQTPGHIPQTVPHTPPPPPPSGGGGGRPAPIPLAVGSFQIMKDNLLALLHRDEMVVPADVSDLLRAIGGGSSPWQTVATGLSAPSATSPRLGRSDVPAAPSAGHGDGNTYILQFGDERFGEITDRALWGQEAVHGRRTTLRTGSSR